MFIFKRGKKRDSENGRGTEREGDTESELSAQSWTRGSSHEPGGHDLS